MGGRCIQLQAREKEVKYIRVIINLKLNKCILPSPLVCLSLFEIFIVSCIVFFIMEKVLILISA